MPRVGIRDDGNTPRTSARVRARDVDNVSREIKRVRMRDASNVLRTVWAALTATAVPANVSGTGPGPTITTNSTTVTPAGGVGPYTHAWTRLAFSGAGDCAATAPNAASTAFTFSQVVPGTAAATWRCTVTDTATGFTAVADVYATATATEPNP